jgi:hypothetical protein
LANGIAAQPFGDRCKCQTTFGAVATCPRSGDALFLGPSEEFLGQPRLADAGHTGEQEQLRFATARALPRRAQLLPLKLAPDQR